jgi:hypothetical protein
VLNVWSLAEKELCTHTAALDSFVKGTTWVPVHAKWGHTHSDTGMACVDMGAGYDAKATSEPWATQPC